MAPVMQHVPRADSNHNQECSGEEVSGNHEDHAGVMDPAHVHDGEDREYPRQSCKVCGCRDGTAEMSAPTPAEMPTAAVRM